MADHLDLAYFREAADFGTSVPRAERRDGVYRGDIERGQLDPALAPDGLLEDQPFALAGMTRGFLDLVSQ
jgi:hypothetical protein